MSSAKYGEEHVAQIITFGTMAAKAAVRDVGRAMNVPYDEVDRAAKLIPHQLGITLTRRCGAAPELREAARTTAEDRQRCCDMAMKVEGMPRHASTHAAGVVISRRAADAIMYRCRQGYGEDGADAIFDGASGSDRPAQDGFSRPAHVVDYRADAGLGEAQHGHDGRFSHDSR